MLSRVSSLTSRSCMHSDRTSCHADIFFGQCVTCQFISQELFTKSFLQYSWRPVERAYLPFLTYYSRAYSVHQIFYSNNASVISADTALTTSWVFIFSESFLHVFKRPFTFCLLDWTLHHTAHQPQLWLQSLRSGLGGKFLSLTKWTCYWVTAVIDIRRIGCTHVRSIRRFWQVW